MPHAIQIRQTGDPEVLNWTPIEVDEPGSGQVRLRQAAAGLNYIDVYHRTGYYSQPLPFIPGLEGAGSVEAIGQDVRGVKVGDRVAYAGPAGGYSEVRLIEADRLVRLPDAISFDQAAAMMLQGMTAQVLIRQVYPVKAGDLILVHAAAGETGLILCQWAAALGATVIGTVSTEAKAEMAHAHGCNHTIRYEILFSIEDRVVAAVGMGHFGLSVRRNGADDRCAEGGRPLTENEARSAGRGMHEDQVTRLDGIHLPDQHLSSHTLQHHRGCLIERDCVR